LWLEAGSNFGVLNDGPPSQNPQSTKQHLVTLLKTAKIPWKAYLENTTGKVCPLTDDGEYAVRHEPFAYFDDVSNHQNSQSKYCIAHLRPYDELAVDLKNDTLPRYVWITPNLCDDMHDSCGGDMIVLSPFAKGKGYSNQIHYTHGSTLRTFEEIFGVKPLLRDAAKEKDLSDMFTAFP
jgi:hypothetical protein